jgi:hypothetical protein
MLCIYHALKSLFKCEHLKALFIAFTKNLRFFACVNFLKNNKSHLSLQIGWLREPTATGNLLRQISGVGILNDQKVATP